MSTKRVLGIDPGTRITGYGLVERELGQFFAVDFGCIRPPAQGKLSEKYLIIYNGISQLIEKYQPEAVSVESQFVSKNAQSALKLGMARGMVILAAAQAGIPVFEYAPSRAKQSVCGHGRASKEQVQRMMQGILKLEKLPQPEDAADALSLAICHLHAINTVAPSGTEI